MPTTAVPIGDRDAGGARVTDDFSPTVDARVLEVFERAADPTNAIELRDLYLGRVEAELGARGLRPQMAERWRDARRQRVVTEQDVLQSRATARFVKELFNWFFRDDLYGALRSDEHVILSSGSVDEEAYGLPQVLKECVRYALDRDWYGYSDSRGRVPARQAVAAYESMRAGGLAYDESNVALTMGGTFAMSAIADFVALERRPVGRAICAIPNYPPLVESVARRMDISLVPVPCRAGNTSLDPVISALRPDTPLVLLQTVTNPTGVAVKETELERLITTASPSTLIVLDECHECLGPLGPQSPARRARNVVRVSSMSKTWSAPGLKLGWILADADFIAAYYEYASTTFGGPPSFFYTLVEVMARMERWLLEGREVVGDREVREFESSYGLSSDRLAVAYASYRDERTSRTRALCDLRDAAVAGLARAGATVVRPRYSINVALSFDGAVDSYGSFRELLGTCGVSVFPGILTLCLGGGTVRITTARQWCDLERAINALVRRGSRR